MSRQTEIPQVMPGEAITASLLNQLVKGANTGRRITGDDTVNVNEYGGQVGVSDPRTPPISDKGIPVRIMATYGFGGAKELPLPGGIYAGRMYLQPAVTVPDPAPASSVRVTTATIAPIPNVQTCFVLNYAEENQNTHFIPADMTTNGHVIGYFQGIPLLGVRVTEPIVTVKITAAAAGGGKYLGRLVTGATTTANFSTLEAGTLAMPEGATVANSNNVLFYNLAENGSSGHALAVDGTCFVVGKVTGNTLAGDVFTVEGNVGAIGGGGASLVYAKTATGDTRTTAGTFAATTPAIAMTVGAVYRFAVSLVARNTTAAQPAGPIFGIYTVTAGGLLGIAVNSGVMFANDGWIYVDIQFEITITDSTHASYRQVATFNDLPTTGGAPVSPITTLYSIEGVSFAAANGLEVRWTSGTAPLVTLCTMTLEKIR